MRRYEVEIISRTDGGGMSLVLVAAPAWSRWLIRCAYRVLRATDDRHGVGLAAKAYRIHERVSRKFVLPSTPGTVEQYRQWRRGAGLQPPPDDGSPTPQVRL